MLEFALHRVFDDELEAQVPKELELTLLSGTEASSLTGFASLPRVWRRVCCVRGASLFRSRGVCFLGIALEMSGDLEV